MSFSPTFSKTEDTKLHPLDMVLSQTCVLSLTILKKLRFKKNPKYYAVILMI